MKQDTSELFKGKKFKWSVVFSGFNAAKTKEEKERQIMSGLPGNVPYESEMIREWQPPFLFYKFFLYCIVMMVLIFITSYLYGFGDVLLVSAVPYMIPLTLLIFIWEMNIPRNISILDMFYIAAFSGIICYLVIFFIEDMTQIGYGNVSVFTMPLLAEVSQLLIVCVFLRKKSRGYGLNGLLIGAAVGAGYSILTAADDLFYVAEYVGRIEGAMGLAVVRIIMVLGGDILWMAAVGGALALSKGKEPLKAKHLGNSLFLICLIGTYLMAVLWDYDLTNFFARFADSEVAMSVYIFLTVYEGKRILLTIVAWALFLFIARKGVEQTVMIAEQARNDKRNWDSKIAANYVGKAEIFGISGTHGGQKFTCSSQSILFGRDGSCGVKFSGNAKGISSIHCEIKKQGDGYVLIDKNSSYGTFWKNGEKLEPGKAYTLRDGAEFYLASEDNSYKVSVRQEQNQALSAGMQFGRRTNEIDGVEESGQNVYIACGIVLVAMFMAFFMTSVNSERLSIDAGEYAEGTSAYYGAWVSDSYFDVKNIILNNIDNLFTSLDITLFKDSYVNGITFTQDGMAYCTYNGKAVDYAKFTCSVVDDSTLHLQWAYETMVANAGAGIGIFETGVSKSIGDETGFDVRYEVDGNTMYLNFAGQYLELYKY